MEHVIRQTLIALRMGDAARPRRGRRGGPLLLGPAGLGGLPHRCLRAGQVVRRRHRRQGQLPLDRSPGAGRLLHQLGLGDPGSSGRGSLLALVGHGHARPRRRCSRTTGSPPMTLARRLGLGDDVRQSLKESYERWDGQGAFGTKGEQIRLTSRLVQLADVVDGLPPHAGVSTRRSRSRANAAARSSTRHWSTSSAGMRPACSASSTGEDTGTRCSPPNRSWAGPSRTNSSTTSLEAIADFIDLKSPYTIGHSRGVADLAAAAAASLRAAGRRRGRRCAGPDWCMTSAASASRTRSGTSAGRSRQREIERVRLHPYLTERMLAFSPALAPLGAIAVQHHERLDGSGYPRGLVRRRDHPGRAAPRRGRRVTTP